MKKNFFFVKINEYFEISKMKNLRENFFFVKINEYFEISKMKKFHKNFVFAKINESVCIKQIFRRFESLKKSNIL